MLGVALVDVFAVQVLVVVHARSRVLLREANHVRRSLLPSAVLVATECTVVLLDAGLGFIFAGAGLSLVGRAQMARHLHSVVLGVASNFNTETILGDHRV